MSYNRSNYIRVRDEFERKSAAAREEAERRRDELHAKFHEIEVIDEALSQTGVNLLMEALNGPVNIAERVEKLGRDNRELQRARGDFLVAHGYPADYSKVKYECENCSDTGFDSNGNMCQCMKKALILAGYESSGAGALMKRQSFSSFDLSFYSEGAERAEMESIFSSVSTAAEDFDGKAPINMLFIGATGLGKTHLSSAYAKRLIERGFDVVYDSAQNIFSAFEYEKFVRGYADRDEASRTQKYFDCDCLIIDDLGAEAITQFTVACLYNLLNTRVSTEKSVLINTNIAKQDILKKYSERIASRLFGEFNVYVFRGRDIRTQKLKRG